MRFGLELFILNFRQLPRGVAFKNYCLLAHHAVTWYLRNAFYELGDHQTVFDLPLIEAFVGGGDGNAVAVNNDVVLAQVQ